MSYPYESVAEDYEAHCEVRRTCRNCYTQSRNLTDGWCDRCNGLDVEPEESPAKRAWDKFYREHPEFTR